MKKEKILNLINELKLGEGNDEVLDEILDEISAILTSSDDIGKVLICAINAPNNKKDSYAKVIATILEKSPPYSVRTRKGPLELLNRNLSNDKRTTYLSFALNKAIEDENNVKIFAEIIRYYSLNKEILFRRKAAKDFVQLLSGKLKDAILNFEANKVELLSVIMSDRLDLTEGTILHLVLCQVLMKSSDTVSSPFPLTEIFKKMFRGYFSSYHSVMKFDTELNDHAEVPSGTICLYTKKGEEDKESYYFRWRIQETGSNEKCYSKESQALSEEALQFPMKINGKTASILEHLKALPSNEPVTAPKLLDFFLNNEQGCPFEKEETFCRIFFAILDKASLYPTLLCDFLTKRDPSDKTIFHQILRLNEFKKITSRIYKEEVMGMRHGLSTKFLDTVLCALFSQLSDGSLLKVSDILNGLIFASMPYTDPYSVERILKHWIRYLLKSSEKANNDGSDILLNLLKELMQNDDLGTIFELALKELISQRQFGIFKKDLQQLSSFFHTSKENKNLLMYAFVTQKKKAIWRIFHLADELALKAILPLNEMRNTAELPEPNNAQLRMFAHSDTGTMLFSPNMCPVVLKTLSAKEDLASKDFVSLYFKICCIYGVTGGGLGYEFPSMARSIVNSLSGQTLYPLLQEDSRFLFCLAKEPLPYEIGRLYFLEKLRVEEAKLQKKDSFLEHWDFSDQTLSLTEIKNVFAMATSHTGCNRLIMTGIFITEEEAIGNETFMSLGCPEREFTLDLRQAAEEDNDDRPNTQWVRLISMRLIACKKPDDMTSLTIFLDEGDLQILSTLIQIDTLEARNIFIKLGMVPTKRTECLGP
jgi:hypothetical protein